MFRQKTGSVVCASCGSLVGVNDDTCYSADAGIRGCGARPGAAAFGNDFGFTTVIVYGCIVLFALELVLTVLSGGNLFGGSVFSMLGPNRFASEALGGRGDSRVLQHRWWTVLSAAWLHGGALHILFNMMWVRQLGPAVEDMYGGARMVIIYTLRPSRGSS